ncbi:MAG: hypothetical protein EOM91_22095 [Sphingobacteriia bacterium]|nr:hypothetical protein [Sphingobacteriia bacterium]
MNITRESIEDALRNHPGVTLFVPKAKEPRDIIPMMMPRFDHSENQRIAARVGFDPFRSELASELLQEPCIDLPEGITRAQRHQAEFFAALGMFVFIRQEDDGIEIPPDLAAWHAHYVRCMHEQRFFAEARP